MVFESLVADLVNRYLGDFVENLDKSQLKIGIWGGDVVLNNLFIKQSALDDLDLPVKVLHGNIGKLVLKVPWKNLYTEPTIATLEGLYIVAVPNKGVKYDAEKEQKAEWEAKQKELQRIEEAKKAEAEKDKPSDPKADTFAEKLATNVIKNLQVRVSDIHVRYEDKVTNPKCPFAIGVTLKGLLFQTTDEKWSPTVIKDAVSMIHKLVELDSLALYWNTEAQMYTDFQREHLQKALKNNIAFASNSTDFKYLIQPISSSAKLRLNTKPEKDKFSIPKVLLNVIFEEIGIALTKGQFQNVMELLESFERMNLSTNYRKYMRPTAPIHGNSKHWWHFAYRCVLEESVLRKKRMFSWDNILKHRQMVREYKEAYKKKLGLKKIPADLQSKLEGIEKQLTVFNITLARQTAELEVMRNILPYNSVSGFYWVWLLDLVTAPVGLVSSVLPMNYLLPAVSDPLVQAKKEGIKKQKEAKGGWFSGWWGGGQKTETKEENQADIGEQFQKLMTDEEKAKLYKAVGYEETVGDPTLPTEYVSNELNFNLNALSITLKDDVKKCNIVKVKLSDTFAKLQQRPAASAIKLSAKMDSVNVQGAPDPRGHTPLMVSSQNKEANQTFSLLDVLFETNPLDGQCDTRVKVNARPLEIIYDAATINQVADFFKPPESVHLTQLQTAAMSKFEELKEQTATGLQYAIEQRKYTEIAVDLKPTYILVPEKGVYTQDCNMLVLDLGSLKVNSKKQERMEVTPNMETLSKDEVMQKAYDQFDIMLAHVQLLYSSRGTDWQAERRKTDSPQHILKPMSLSLSLYKGFLEDVSLPKMRIKGELPSLNVLVSDKRLEEILCLVNSIPFPESAPPPPEEVLATWEAPNVAETVAQEGSAQQLVKKFVVEPDSSSDEEGVVKKKPGKIEKQVSREYVNMTEVDLHFEIKEISLTVSQKQRDGKEVPLVKVVIDCLGTNLQLRTFDLKVSAYLGGIYVQHMQFKAYPEIEKYCNGGSKALYGGPLINLVNTPVTDDSTFKLLSVTYTKADKKGPEFKTLYKNTEQTIDVHFSALEVLLHQEAIVSLMQFAQDLQEALEASSPKKESPSQDSIQSAPQVRARRPSSSSSMLGSLSTAKVRSSRQMKPTEDIDIAIKAKLDVFAVAICNQEKLITDVKIRGLDARVEVQKSKTNISASLKDITVFDPVPDALYPKILTFEGGEVFSMNIIAFNGATQGENYSNMACVDTSILLVTGCMKIVFLNKFVNNLLQFLDQFQAAMDKAKQASLAAAESAADAAKDFSTKATRVKLDIKLKAPVVIVPQNSKSNNTVVVDLGNIRVSNSFTLPGKYSADKVPAVLDKMTVELTAVKMSRALMLGTDMRAECLLLEPVNITVNITRNLAASWYHGHPAVDICGNLESFSVELSQGDFTTVMSLLTENLQEGQPPVKSADQDQTTEKPSGEPATESTITAQVSQPVSSSQATTAAVVPKSQPSEIYTNLKFEFNIRSIKAVLYTGDTSLDSGRTVRDLARSLALFEVQSIGASGQIMSDSSIDCKVALYRIVLEDTRPGREKGITRMIEQTKLLTTSGHTADDAVNMIDVSFTQQPNQNKDIKTSIKGLYICVCLEYLLTVGDFFSKGMPQAPETQAVSSAPTDKPSNTTSSNTKEPTGPSDSSTPPAGDISILLTVEKPEIVLVEDAMNMDTNALILETSVLVKMRLAPDSQTISGTVSQLQILSCVFAEEKREASKQLILDPTDISLNLNAPNGKGHHIAVMIGDIVMTISPAIIRTVTATLGALSSPPEEKSEQVEAELPEDLWAVKKLEDCNFWYIKTADAGSGSDPLGEMNEEVDSRGEQLILQIKHITVKLEGGVGKRTVPLIITEMNLHSEVKDWSTKLFVSAELALEVAYYNESLAVWEPLVEPIEDEGRHRPWEISLEVTQNELLPPVTEGDDEPDALVIPTPKMTIGVLSKDTLQTTITKTSLDVLTKLSKAFGDAYNLVEVKEKPDEITAPFVINNHCGKVLNIQLGNEFEMPEKAVGESVEMDIGDKLQLYDKVVPEKKSSYVSVIRSTQQTQFRKISLSIPDFNVKREIRLMKAEKRAYNIEQKRYPKQQCQLICTTRASYGMKTIDFSSVLQVENRLPFDMELYYKLSDDAKARCGEVLSDQTLSLPMDTVYSPPYELSFKPRDGKYSESSSAFQWRGLTVPKGATLPPVGVDSVLCCPASKTGTTPLYFNISVHTEEIAVDGSEDRKARMYTISINPCVKFQNQLPVPLTYILEGSDETIIEPGEICTMLSLKPGKSSVSLKIKNYMEKEWISSKSIEEKPHELSVISFESNFGSVLDLGVHCENTKGFQKLSVYCPYWMINKTGRTLSYKRDKIGKNEQTGDDVASVHPEDYSGIVLFSFKSKSFFGKKKDDSDNLSLTGSEGSNNSPTGRKGKLKSPKRKKHSKKEDNRSLRKAVKASLKVSDSEWSDKFSLDTVGSSGTVSCKLKAKTYEDNSPSKKSPKMDTSSVLKRIGSTLSSTAMIGVSVGGPTQQGATKLNANQKTVRIKVGVNIQLSSSGLTKIVTFTPFFLLVNQAPYAIACKEVDVKDPKWWDLEPGDCKPFWPMQTDKVKRMVVKVKDTQTETLPFYYTDPHTTLCKLDSKHGGINVQCECHESSVEIMFQEYKPGFASVQLVNHTSDCVLTYIQQGVKNQEPLKLGAKQTSLYTWQDPNQKRELLWSCGEKKNEKNELLKDDIQSFFYNSDRKLYWVSFLDGMQRVLLFTEDIVVATLAQQAGELERLDQEITLSLRGMGLSLVNNHIRKEVAYMAITSSGVIWEEKKKKRFKALKMKQSATIEEAYQKFVDEIAIGKKPNSHVKLDGKIEVDFGETPPKMIRPRKCEIKRSFENGVWLQYRSSSHQMQFHMKIHRLQLDNQLPGAVFPTVLAPIPPPKSVAADSVPKPFTEMSIMIRKREFTNVMQFKYFKVLTQEMSVKVDQGFLNAVLTLFATDEVDEETQRQLLKTDMAVVDRPLMDYAVQSTADEQKHFYDMLHVSPLKVHLSFSLYGAEKDKDSPVQLKSNVLNLFLESVGIVLTDIQDVVFKLAYFERKYNFYNQSQLTGEITRHYSSQAIKQMYVLVLGLDVLGNPFGVIRGLAEGIEDLFYEPYQGAVQGPEEFAEGLALGVRSLLGHAVGGAAGAVSRITGALGKGIATLTLDDEYQKKRREQLNKRPADFKEGLARGGKGLVMGVFDGVTGIVRKPVEGAKEEGVAGFFKGVGKGLVGVVTRPTSGVVDFASGTFEGVKRVAEMSDEVRRVRPPRFLHRDGMVRPYLFKEAEGNDTLQDVEKGKYVTTDQYVAHLVITKDLKNVLLVTDKRVLFVSKGEIFGHWDCDWQYSWEELKEAPSVTQKGIQILLKEKEKKSFFKSGTMGKVIPFEDKQKAGWLVKKMSEAMQKNK